MPASLAAALARDRRLVDAALDRALRFGPEVPARLRRAMRYAVLGRGKRLRPALCLQAYRCAGGRGLGPVLPFACGIEFIHAFSLVHDDLPSMDDDDFRRGRPSLHRRFDEATAILAADGLFALAFELFAGAPGPAERRTAAIAAVARAVGPAGMTGGQLLDIAGPGRAPARLRLMQRKKTADFIAGALAAGALLAGAPGRTVRGLHSAGLLIGELFQVTDDLLDAAQPSDERLATMVSTYGRDGARRAAESLARAAAGRIRRLGPGYAGLAGLPALILERTA